MPPPNLTAATAIPITPLPYATTQQVDEAGTTYTVWYSYTAVDGDIVIGVFGHGQQIGAGYEPRTVVYTGPAGAPVQYLHGIFGPNGKPVQFPVVPGTTYYLEFRTSAGNPAPAILTLSVVRHTTTAGGSAILVNDDTDGFPALLLSSVTGAPLRFLFPFTAGEAGDRLPDGEMLFSDAWHPMLHLYDATFTEILTIPFNIRFSISIRGQQTLDRFYAANNGIDGNPVDVRVYDPGGAQLEQHILTNHYAIRGMAANNAGTILYFSRGDFQEPLRRWDLVNDVDLTDLAAPVESHFIWDILVLADDSIIASYCRFPVSFHVRHYAPDGTLLMVYPVVETGFPVGTIPRLAYGRGATPSFWIWSHPVDEFEESLGLSRFTELRVSDGATLSDVFSVEYESGVYEPPETLTPTARFGNSFSCPFVVISGCPDVLPAPCPAPNGTPAGGPVCLAPNPTGCPSFDAGS